MKFKTAILAGAAAAFMALSGSAAVAGCHKECSSRGHYTYKTVKTRVVTRRAHTGRYYEPAKYVTRKQRIMIRPARTVVRYKAPVYTWKTKRVKVRDSYRRGCYVRRHHRSCGHRSHSKPVYAWRKVRVMVSGPKAYTVKKPAEYINRTINVKVREGRYHRVHVPATYAWRTKRVRVHHR